MKSKLLTGDVIIDSITKFFFNNPILISILFVTIIGQVSMYMVAQLNSFNEEDVWAFTIGIGIILSAAIIATYMLILVNYDNVEKFHNKLFEKDTYYYYYIDEEESYYKYRCTITRSFTYYQHCIFLDMNPNLKNYED